MAGYTEMVGILKAAGELTRLRLLALLAEGELSVKDLTDILKQSQPRVSRHLKLLTDAGLVSRQAEGAWAYFRLAEQGAAGELALRLVSQLDANDPVRLADKRALEQVRLSHQQTAAAYFAGVADSWDLLRSLHVPEEAVEAAILDAVGERPIEVLLDLGTGTGRMLELLSGRYERAVGIDSSREMLGVARAKLASADIHNAQVRLGDIAELEGSNGPADLIVVHQVLHYFDDPGRVIQQAASALGPHGRMLIVDFAPHGLEFLRDEHAHRRLGLSEDQIAAWADAAGLAVSDTRQFPSTNKKQGLTVGLWLLGPKQEKAE